MAKRQKLADADVNVEIKATLILGYGKCRYSHCRKQFEGSSKIENKIKLLYHPALALLYVYPKESESYIKETSVLPHYNTIHSGHRIETPSVSIS